MNTRSLDHNVIIDQQQRAWNSGALRLVTMLLVIGLCIHYVGLFDGVERTTTSVILATKIER